MGHAKCMSLSCLRLRPLPYVPDFSRASPLNAVEHEIQYTFHDGGEVLSRLRYRRREDYSAGLSESCVYRSLSYAVLRVWVAVHFHYFWGFSVNTSAPYMCLSAYADFEWALLPNLLSQSRELSLTAMFKISVSLFSPLNLAEVFKMILPSRC